MMLTISKTQMSALEDSQIRAFEDRTYAHLMKYFPRHYQLLGEEPLRRVIQLGWQKAKSYGLTPESCVRSYIESMCRLGSGFDTDPLLPWAARILNDLTTFGPVERGDRLYDQAWEYMDAISQDYRDPAGQPTTGRFVGEIRSLRQGNDEVVAQTTYPHFAQHLAGRIEANFPAKCHYVGELTIRKLIPHGVRSARAYNITTERGITLFTLFLFVLGKGFADDPLLPWASAVLNDQAIRNEIDRVDKLYAEGVGFLKRWWDSAPEQGA